MRALLIRRLVASSATVLSTVGLMIAVVGCGSSSHSSTQSASGKTSNVTLTIGGWGGVIDQATQRFYLNPFKTGTGISARFVDAPGAQLARVEAQVQAGQVQWDALDSVDGGSAYSLYAKGDVAPLPSQLHAAFERELGPKVVTPFGFSHGSLGDVIVCNMAKMHTCPTSMAEFYNTKMFPQPRMFGGIEPIEASTTAEVAMGIPSSATSTTPLNVNAIVNELKKIKPTVKAFWQSGDQQLQIMRSGQVDMGIMWSDRAYQLISQGVPLKVVWTGGAYEPSYWSVLSGAPHKAQAFELLNWIATHPQAEAKWAALIHDSVPNPKVLTVVPHAISTQMSDNPRNLNQLATPNFTWYAKNGPQLDMAYENFLRG